MQSTASNFCLFRDSDLCSWISILITRLDSKSRFGRRYRRRCQPTSLDCTFCPTGDSGFHRESKWSTFYVIASIFDKEVICLCINSSIRCWIHASGWRRWRNRPIVYRRSTATKEVHCEGCAGVFASILVCVFGLNNQSKDFSNQQAFTDTE